MANDLDPGGLAQLLIRCILWMLAANAESNDWHSSARHWQAMGWSVRIGMPSRQVEDESEQHFRLDRSDALIRKARLLISGFVLIPILLTEALGASPPAGLRSVDPLSLPAPDSSEPLLLPNDVRSAGDKILPTLWEQALATKSSETLRVIVSLHEPVLAAEGASAEEQEARRVANVSRVEHVFAASAADLQLRNVRGLSHFAIVFADVAPENLIRLAALPTVKSIERVWPVAAARVQGGALINATQLRNTLGGNGAGVAVAVIDSGVDGTHPELATKVTVQANYTNEPGDGTLDGNSHGTYVAGIVAGANGGLAPQAAIWAVKVLDHDGNGSTEWTLAALEGAYANRDNFGGLDLINLSLAIPSLSRNSNCDAEFPAESTVVNQLVSEGITVFAASGNDGFKSGISSPACLANVISVGAVSDAPNVVDVGCVGNPTAFYSQADQILCYSNSGIPLDILAPSACASTPRSSLVGGGLNACFNGTSAATPYATAAAAQILSLRPSTSPAQLRTALMASGKPITDVNGLTRNRIDALQAYQSLAGGNTACVDSPTRLCLLNKRFSLEATFRTPSGTNGQAKAVRLTEETGYFWFFNESNIEAVVKLLNACGLNSRFWVFAGGLTDVEVSVRIVDTQGGATKVYQNPLSTPFAPIQDTDAFATCP